MQELIFRFGKIEIDMSDAGWLGKKLDWNGIIGRIQCLDLWHNQNWRCPEDTEEFLFGEAHNVPCFDILAADLYLHTKFKALPIRLGQRGTLTVNVGDNTGTVLIRDKARVIMGESNGLCEFAFEVKNTQPPKKVGQVPYHNDDEDRYRYWFKVQLWVQKDPLKLFPGNDVNFPNLSPDVTIEG